MTVSGTGALRAIAIAFATGLLVFGLRGFFHPATLPPVQYWWLMVAACGIAIAGLSAATEWSRAGAVAATLLVGFGAQLAFKDPLWFQYYHLKLRIHLAYLILGTILLQAAVGFWTIARARATRALPAIVAEFGSVRLACALALLLLASVGGMDLIAENKFRSLLNQYGFAIFFAALNLASFAALVITLPEGPLRRLSGSVTNAISLPGSDDRTRTFDARLPLVLALGVLVFGLFGRLVVFANVPHIDEVIYLIEAKYFAQGRLTLPMPPVPSAFDIFMMTSYHGMWFDTASPGWPGVLAAGVFLGVPWLVNPLFAAVSVLLLHFIVRSVSDRGMANLAALLLAVSPWFLWTSTTLMTHSLTLVLVLGAWALLIRSRTRPSFTMPFLAGALMGIDFLTRPLEGVLMGGLTGLWILTFLKDRAQWRTVILYGIGCIAIGGLTFPYNAYLTGNPMLPPMNAYLDALWGPGSTRFGFGPNIGPKPSWAPVDPLPGHTPYEALIQAKQMYYGLYLEMFGWPIGSVFFALFFVFWGRWSKLTAAMAAIIVVIVGAHALYWFAAFDYIGPRYWFMVLVPLVVLTAAGILACIERAERIFPGALAPQRISAAVVFMSICATLGFSSWVGFNKYPGFRGYHGDYQAMAAEPRFRHSLIFVRMDEPLEYENAIWLNDYQPQSDQPVFARDLGSQTNRLVAAGYPGRPIYFVNGRPHHAKVPARVEMLSGPLGPDKL